MAGGNEDAGSAAVGNNPGGKAKIHATLVGVGVGLAACLAAPLVTRATLSAGGFTKTGVMPGTIASSLQSSGGGFLFNTLHSMGKTGIGGKVAVGLGIALGTAAAIFTFFNEKKKKKTLSELTTVEDQIPPTPVVTEIVTKSEEPVQEAIKVKTTESAPTQTQPNKETVKDLPPVVVTEKITKQVPSQELNIDLLANSLASQIQEKPLTLPPVVAELTPPVSVQQERVKVEESVPINEPVADAVNIPVVNNAREDVEEEVAIPITAANKPSTFEQLVRAAVQDEEYEDEEEEEEEEEEVESDENDVHIIFPSDVLGIAAEKVLEAEFSIDNLVEPVVTSVKLEEIIAAEPVNAQCDMEEDQPNSSEMSSIEVLETKEQVSEMMAAVPPPPISSNMEAIATEEEMSTPELASVSTPAVEYVAKVVKSETVASPFVMENESEQENSDEEYESEEEDQTLSAPRGSEIKDRLLNSAVPESVVSSVAKPGKQDEFSWESDEQIESEIR